jgi:hypothetical protein
MEFKILFNADTLLSFAGQTMECWSPTGLATTWQPQRRDTSENFDNLTFNYLFALLLNSVY